MKKLIVLCCFISLHCGVSAQFYKKHENDKLKFYGTLDLRNSVVFEENLAFYGAKIGFGNKRVRFGLGYHELSKSVVNFLIQKDPFTPVSFDEKYFTYRHVSAYIDPILFQNQRWELLFPIHLGFGPIKAFMYDTSGKEQQIISRDFVPSFTVSIKANYRILKWFGITAGFGDNFVFLDDSQFGKEFNTVFYSFGVKLFLNEFSRFVKDKEYRKKYVFKFDFIDD